MVELIQGETRTEIDATIEEVMEAIEYLRRQRKLQREKHKRLYVPSSNPVGRPRKNPPAENIPKRGRGRPKKNPSPAESIPSDAPPTDI